MRGTAFSEKELAKYYQLSRDYLRRCGVGGREPAPPPDQPPAPEDPAPRSAGLSHRGGRQKAAAARQKGSRSAAGTPSRERAQPLPAPALHARRPPAREPARRSRTSREEEPGSRAAVVLALAALVIGFGSAGSPDGRAAPFCKNIVRDRIWTND